MFRRWLAGLTLSLMVAVPSAAFDVSSMNEDEKAAFGEAVRDYLMENPTLLREWIDALQEQEAAEATALDAALVASNSAAIFDDGHSFVGGNPDGDLTLVEFLDSRCGYCKRAHPEVAELLASDGNIRIIIKEFPILGEESVAASRFAIAVKQIAGDEAYKLMGDTLMTHRGQFGREALSRLANTAGLDAEAIFVQMESEDVTDVIRKNHALAQELAISGTPTFILGDQMLRGYLPLDDMRSVVAQVRAE
jgi:protein-disulfide isomerase